MLGHIATITVVAVKAGRDLSLVECGLLQAELEECVDASLDLLVVDNRDLIVVWEALTHGKLVYHCGSQYLAEYYEDLVRAIDGIADLEPVIKLFREEISRVITRPNSQNGVGEKELGKTQKDSRNALV